MSVFEVSMNTSNYAVSSEKIKTKASDQPRTLIFNFGRTTLESPNSKYVVNSTVGNILCKTQQEKNDFIEFYKNISFQFDNKNNELYDIFEQKKAAEYKRYENKEISKHKYNSLCKQYLKEYKESRLKVWAETQEKIKEKARQMGLQVIETRSWQNPFN